MIKQKKSHSRTENTSTSAPFISKKRRKKKWPVLILLILVIAGIGYYFRAPLINQMRTLPIVGALISDSSKEESLSMEMLSNKVDLQEREIEKLKKEKVELENQYTVLTEQNNQLKQYEEMYTDFLAQKEAWDEEVAKTNTDLFIEQFEQMYPDTAERLYTVLKSQKILSDKQKALSKTIEQMEETQAAKALELLITTDTDLLRVIFEGMSTDRKALILSEMSAQSAAQIIKLIAPESQMID